jgi:hypothetical protein
MFRCEFGRELRELTFVAGRRHRNVAEVVVEVEVRVLDPERVVEAERHGDEPAPERRDKVQAFGHEVAHLGERERVLPRLEDRERRHVAVRRRRFHGEEAVVETRQLTHGHKCRVAPPPSETPSVQGCVCEPQRLWSTDAPSDG